jgi:hypothetical protein
MQTTMNRTNRNYVDEMNVRAAAVEESTIDEQNRTARAVLSTDRPVMVYDWRSRQVIEEVLTTRGGVFPSQLPLFDDHWVSSARQLGSVRNITQGRSDHVGELHFARDAGTMRDEAWEMVRQRHVTDVSIGYTYGEGDYTDIAPGQRATIDGVEYTAGKRTKRVVTKWRAKEVSTTPIGADDMAKIRRQVISNRTDENTGVNSQRHDQHDQRDQSSHSNRSTHSARATMDGADQTTPGTQGSTDGGDQESGQRNGGTTATATPPAGTGGEGGGSAAPAPSGNGDGGSDSQRNAGTTIHAPGSGESQSEREDRIRRQERERLTLLAGYVRFEHVIPEQDRQRALDENWSPERIRQEFDHRIVQAMAEREPVQPNHRGQNDGSSPAQRALGLALLMRHGIEPDHRMLRTANAQTMLGGNCRASWLTQAARSLHQDGTAGETERIFDQARQMSAMPMRDFVRKGLELEGVRTSSLYDPGDLMQRASSSAAVAAIFTLAFNARLLAGYESIPDTTGPFVKNDVLPNFQPAERIQMGKYTRLKLRERGSSPEHTTTDAVKELLQVFEYAEMFIVDEQDIRDDTMGGIGGRMTPEEMGEAAAELRPDLVYSYLLQNPNMNRDAAALISTARGNLRFSSALTDDNLTASSAAMSTQRLENGRHINVQGDVIVVARTKRDDAFKLVRSREVRRSDEGNFNVHENAYTIVAEPRLDTGVESPLNGTFYSGEPNNWYLMARNGRHGMSVATLSGRGNRPRVRRLQNVNHGYAMGWSVDHVLGVGATGFEGIQKNDPDAS